jgi:hypothetical protein
VGLAWRILQQGAHLYCRAVPRNVHIEAGQVASRLLASNSAQAGRHGLHMRALARCGGRPADAHDITEKDVAATRRESNMRASRGGSLVGSVSLQRPERVCRSLRLGLDKCHVPLVDIGIFPSMLE